MAVDEEKLGEFMGRFVGDLGAVLHAPLIVLGDKLGLYRAAREGAGDAGRARASERARRSATSPSGSRRTRRPGTSSTTRRRRSTG